MLDLHISAVVVSNISKSCLTDQEIFTKQKEVCINLFQISQTENAFPLLKNSIVKTYNRCYYLNTYIVLIFYNQIL